LRVLDPDVRADQPMAHPAGGVLVYNGEVYNFVSLRTVLEAEGQPFRTTGDSEVVLAALARWGTAALERFDGQFAMGLWDPAAGRLMLARDRLGIKPLFWAEVEGGVVFASELPAVLAHPGVRRDVDGEALGDWLQLGYTAGERTLARGVRRLAPGSILTAGEEGIRIERWYDLPGRLRSAGANATDRGFAEALDGEVLRSVGQRLVSDVPLGCFLSGGIDSALVAAAAAAAGGRPLAVTASFEAPFDETSRARRTASALGLEHRVVPCSAEQMLRLMDSWSEVAGDPLADPSLAPTWLISGAARRELTVVLSGDGGDELLSGYPRLRFMPRLERLWGLPGARAALLGGPLPSRRWAAKLRAAAAAPTLWHAYQCLQGVWPGPRAAVLLGRSELPLPWPAAALDAAGREDPWRRYRLLDCLTFLPERMLAKVDRASMAHGLEVRVPLLDHRIAELLLGAPGTAGRGKGVFRKILATRLPGVPLPRRKRGFEVPLAAWLRGPLRRPVENALFGATAPEIGLDPGVLRSEWEEHQAGRADHAERLFAIHVLVQWCRTQLG
ncbi:MAG: asparagine synthase (glutamine-hydrolyzing), partial [Acidobacteria bacterium]|nr:asparagine synthase (glutamine-hydrolyzing) [Acidobacteriota bacterium]